jgi:hypothetical protein
MSLKLSSYEGDVHRDGRQPAGDGEHAVVHAEPVAQDRSCDEHSNDVDGNAEALKNE